MQITLQLRKSLTRKSQFEFRHILKRREKTDQDILEQESLEAAACPLFGEATKDADDRSRRYVVMMRLPYHKLSLNL